MLKITELPPATSVDRTQGSVAGETGRVDGKSSKPEAEAETSVTGDIGPEGEELASLPPEKAKPELEVDDNPEQLIGLDAAGLEELLGTPKLIRQESPAEIWQYNAADCVLDLVFYDALTSYVEARNAAVQPMDKRSCFRSLLLARQRP
ncbi:hypothetical protein O4H49_09285 [Kiloniella laminariae]|uniref:Uncharacterized protein n=1 Tax=Kiloniella laminariae TaxID=454162 RepID=A0ABT4LIN9_9PROT|nr:hypothetical protein [Kiloniella laminariae]MCZ4280968.1 hypothetical protein [Kiloniella laminariae]